MDVGKIGQKVLKYGIKAAGVAGVGICAYDAHRQGRFCAEMQATSAENNSLNYWYKNSRNLSTPSTVNSRLKDKLFEWQLHHSYLRFINKGIGYVEGIAKSLFDDMLPVGLSIAAIATKGKVAPKVAGGALGAYAAVAFIKNVLGIGVKRTQPL